VKQKKVSQGRRGRNFTGQGTWQIRLSPQGGMFFTAELFQQLKVTIIPMAFISCCFVYFRGQTSYNGYGAGPASWANCGQ